MPLSFIFLFLFSFCGNATSYVAIPQPSMEICKNNGEQLIKESGSFTSLHTGPFNAYKCLDMSKSLPYDFTWDIKEK